MYAIDFKMFYEVYDIEVITHTHPLPSVSPGRLGVYYS